eukprot:2471022-Rhodomonas_salina.4
MSAYDCIALRSRCAIRGTDVVSAYARAMRCPVLSYGVWCYQTDGAGAISQLHRGMLLRLRYAISGTKIAMCYDRPCYGATYRAVRWDSYVATRC